MRNPTPPETTPEPPPELVSDRAAIDRAIEELAAAVPSPALPLGSGERTFSAASQPMTAAAPDMFRQKPDKNQGI